MLRSQVFISEVLAMIGAQVALNYQRLDQSDNQHIAELGRKHLQYLPKNSIVISQGDMVTNSMRYLIRCEKFRSDVLLLDETMMTYKWVRDVQGPKMGEWNISFPNTHLAPPGYSSLKMYTMEQVSVCAVHAPCVCVCVRARV